MSKEIINTTEDIVQFADDRLPISQLVEQLKSYDCPDDIFEKLQEWMLQLVLDRVKLAEWNKNSGSE